MVTILTPIDHLGKFAGKSDEGFLVGYSLQSKAFRVYNLVTKRVEENLHINFLENKPNVAGKGPNWLFDLDYLTDSMNYHSVRSENQANLHAGQQESNHNTGTKDKIGAGDSEKEVETDQDCFELPIWHSYSSTKKGGPREEEQIFLDDLASLQRQEEVANEEAEALRKTLEQETENLVTEARAAKSSSTNIFSTVSTTAKASGTNLVNTVSIPVSTANSKSTNQLKPNNQSYFTVALRMRKNHRMMDGYPLPEIDWKVESLCGFPFKCFLDAYKGYHQIQMAEEDEEKTAFITNQGIFCYTKMPFGLRNAGATYQRLVDKTFHGQIGRNLEVYVDDLVIKSRTEDEVVRDIEETFKTLRKINMKLNPKKCTFGVEEGMFLGYQVNTKGIKICPDKVDAVLSLQSPKCLKDVQKLNGKLASLNRFLAKSAEKSLPFFKTLKKCTKKSDFLWTEEAEAAFKQMKEHIAKLPMLIAPEEQEELIVYLAASKEAVSAVLMTEREARQMPIYFVSRALRGPEINYTAMEKLVLALIHASKRLRRYFQAHPITVITDQPIKNILSNPEVAGRMQKWSIQLGEFGIHYRPRVSVKGQVLADFIVERPEEEGQDDSAKEEEPLPARWTLFTDGSSCVDGCGAGVILTDPEGVEFTYALRFQFETTNNEAEYEALIAGLRIAEKMGVKNLEVNVDSKLVANQVNGTYIAKETDMIKYLEKVKALTSNFRAKQVLVEELKEKSVNEREVHTVVEEEGDTWMTPIREYLTDETLPAERKKARAIKRKSQRFAMINEILYKKSFLGPWLRCVGPSQPNYVLREIHEGSCSMHAGTRSVVAKALRTGYYWPTMHKDARALIKACQECQVHRPVPRNPQEKLNPITSPWPFYKWGIDIAGTFPKGPGKVKFLILAMDYFTKWIEVKPVATITGNQTNGLVERANRSFGEGIKASLGKDNQNWLEEISHVLLAHRIMIKSSNGDTPFSLTYGTEAVIPAEIGMPMFRITEVNVAENDEALEINLELLKEKREQAAIKEVKSKRQMEKYYNTKVRNTSSKPGDLVYSEQREQAGRRHYKVGPKGSP
ncbi:reverse transcriptase domain-containing protein [Tanacetum coccineum]